MIDMKTAKTIENMSQKVNHMDTAVTDFFNKMSDVLERQFGDDEVYTAVIAPEIELTIAPLANVRSYLPCFDETDSCYSISEDVPLAPRHLDIHQNQIRLELFIHFHRLKAIFRP